MNVTAIRTSEWEKDGQKVTTYWVSLEGRDKEVPCYDGGTVLEVGKALPDGWEVKVSQKGKEYLAAPKAGKGGGFGGGAAAWRNTREGQAYEQERMDRRTALMQAVSLAATLPWDERVRLADLAELVGVDDYILLQAAELYEWLRKSAGTLPSSGAADRAPVLSPSFQPEPASSPPPGRPAGQTGGAADKAGDGEAPAESAASHVHEWNQSPTLKTFEVCKCGQTRRK